MPKLVIDLQRGFIEVDASDQFIARVYSDVRDTIMSKLAGASVQRDNNAEPEGEPPTPAGNSAKKTRKRARTGGPSCASRIEAMKEDGFFKEPKSNGDIAKKLKERGTTYQSNRIAAALVNLTQNGKLRRFNENGWKYQNP